MLRLNHYIHHQLVNINSEVAEERVLWVTNPTGLMTSPRLNPYPGLAILKFVTSNVSDPIPVVDAAPTSTSTNNPTPVVVVLPNPILETPSIVSPS